MCLDIVVTLVVAFPLPVVGIGVAAWNAPRKYMNWPEDGLVNHGINNESTPTPTPPYWPFH